MLTLSPKTGALSWRFACAILLCGAALGDGGAVKEVRPRSHRLRQLSRGDHLPRRVCVHLHAEQEARRRVRALHEHRAPPRAATGLPLFCFLLPLFSSILGTARMDPAARRASSAEQDSDHYTPARVTYPFSRAGSQRPALCPTGLFFCQGACSPPGQPPAFVLIELVENKSCLLLLPLLSISDPCLLVLLRTPFITSSRPSLPHPHLILIAGPFASDSAALSLLHTFVGMSSSKRALLPS